MVFRGYKNNINLPYFVEADVDCPILEMLAGDPARGPSVYELVGVLTVGD